jgi:hypothetical protein
LEVGEIPRILLYIEFTRILLLLLLVLIILGGWNLGLHIKLGILFGGALVREATWSVSI